MSLKEKIERLNKDVSIAQEQIRGLNIRAADFSGVAVVIPQDAPFPASYFKGCKVILHNVRYDHSVGCICATITFPHGVDTEPDYSGHTQQVNINENWFE